MDLWAGGKRAPSSSKIYQHVINMHWADILTHTSIRICVIIAFFIILTLLTSAFRIDNVAKDALFAMYA